MSDSNWDTKSTASNHSTHSTRSSSSSSSDDDRGPGGVLAAGVMLGMFAAERVRELAARRTMRRRRERREGDERRELQSGDMKMVEESSPQFADGMPGAQSVGREFHAVGSGYAASTVTSSSGVQSGGSAFGAQNVTAMQQGFRGNDGWSEITDEDAFMAEMEVASAGERVLAEEGVSVSCDALEKVGNRVYSRMRVDRSWSEVEVVRERRVKRRQPRGKRGKKKVRRKTERMQWEEGGAGPAGPPGGLLRWNRAARSGGLADLCKF